MNFKVSDLVEPQRSKGSCQEFNSFIHHILAALAQDCTDQGIRQVLTAVVRYLAKVLDPRGLSSIMVIATVGTSAISLDIVDTVIEVGITANTIAIKDGRGDLCSHLDLIFF